ncbi:MAG: diguanylate cyclase [Thermoanaerobaculia bacterium]|nr:diguanylate cyclase [Thermoanaerobaculia bacterium]
MPKILQLLGLILVLNSWTTSAIGGASFRTLGRAEGLPSTQVHDLAQSSSGEIWISGPAGLTRYDGVSTRVFGPADGLTTQGLRSVETAEDGTLWLGTDQGLERRRGDGTFESVAVDEAWTFGVIERIVADGDTVWIASANGLVAWRAEIGARRVEEVPATRVTDLSLDREGRIWVVGPEIGLYVGGTDGFSPIDSNGWEALGPLHLVDATTDWVLLAGDLGFGQMRATDLLAGGRGDSIEVVALVLTALRRVGQELWVGSGEGLSLYRSWQSGDRHRERLVEGVSVSEIFGDRQDNVWVATGSRGIFRFSWLRHFLTQPDNPCATQVYSIRQDPAGGFLVGGDLCSWRVDDRLTVVEVFEGLAGQQTWDLSRLRDGSLMAATQTGLRASVDGAHWEELVSHSALQGGTRVVMEREGELLVGTLAGLIRLEDGEATEVLDAEGRGLGYVYTLAEDSAGQLWLGTIGRGLFRESHGVLTQVESENLMPRGNVYAITHSSSGDTVVLQDSRTVRLSASGERLLSGVPGDPIAGWAARFDPASGDLFVGSSSGLLHYTPEDLTPKHQIMESSGLGGQEFTTSRGLHLTQDGRLLCGLSEGWSSVSTELFDSQGDLPSVALGDVLWYHVEARTNALGTVVEAGSWTLDISLFAPWYIDEDSLLFEYRLRGFDEDWSEAIGASSLPLRFTSLSPGSYSLEARAGSTLVGWGPTVQVYQFVVEPHWYTSWWAMAIATGASLLLLVLLWRWRTRRLRTLARELEEHVRNRTAELDEANQSLERLVTQDALTGLPNQRSIWSRLDELHALSQRHGEPFAVIVLDLDNFKAINDRWGHLEGDEVLREAARRTRSALRQSDMLARFGGEEFVALLGRTTEDEAMTAAEHMRSTLAREPMMTTDGESVEVTASFGVAVWKAGDVAKEVFRRADDALYQAKELGKNRVAALP